MKMKIIITLFYFRPACSVTEKKHSSASHHRSTKVCNFGDRSQKSKMSLGITAAPRQKLPDYSLGGENKHSLKAVVFHSKLLSLSEFTMIRICYISSTFRKFIEKFHFYA